MREKVVKRNARKNDEINHDVREEDIPIPYSAESILTEEDVNYVKRIRVLVDVLNVRSEGAMSAKVIGKTYENDIHDVLAVESDIDRKCWYQVMLPTGEKGWITEEFCKVVTFIDYNYEAEKSFVAHISQEMMPVWRTCFVGGDVVGYVYYDELCKIVETKVDVSKGTWYKIKTSTGVEGWLEGWYCNDIVTKAENCKKIVDKDGNSKPFINERIYELFYQTANKQFDKIAKGRILDFDEKYKDVFLDVLKLDYSLWDDNPNYTSLDIWCDDETLDMILKNFYYNYEKVQVAGYDTYLVGDDIKVVDEMLIYSYMFGNSKLTPSIRINADILSSPGDEVIVSYTLNKNDYLLIFSDETDEILYCFRTDFIRINDISVGDYTNDGKNELYVHTLNYLRKRDYIYKVVDDEFVLAYDNSIFSDYQNKIQTKLQDNRLQFNLDFENYVISEWSLLPGSLFLDAKNRRDQNTLLSMDKQWEVVEENGQWYYEVDFILNLDTVKYADDSGYYDDYTQTEIGRVKLLVKVVGDKMEIKSISHELKYGDRMSTVRQLAEGDASIKNGPCWGMTLEEAYVSLGGNPVDVKGKTYFSYKDVNVYQTNGIVDYIGIWNKEYESVRGLKVGDSRERVEELYGIPDGGYNPDNVKYYCLVNTEDGEKLNRNLMLCVDYVDNVVEYFNFWNYTESDL